MIDPPREEVIVAVRRCRDAGIRPIMITGDHPDTARAIGREIGIADDNSRLVTGAELDKLPDEQLTREVTTIPIYARVTAAHKLRVVKAWQQNDAVVAVTGDGVNDAPAVKSADIGIAMGITGSDVTKESADMVLTDDNFASIVSAVEEGRGIFDNIQKFVHYLLSCNASEVFLMLIAGIAGWPAPLGALQILWINLVTDGLPALALGLEPPEKDVMQRAPRARRAPVIDWPRGLQMLRHGLLMSATSSIAFWWVYRGDAGRLVVAQSSVFCVVAFTQLFYSLSCRSHRYTMPEIGPFSNPYLNGAIIISAFIQVLIVSLPVTRTLFDLDTALFAEWPVILAAALTPATVIELTKLARRWLSRSRS
jgi:Ca2+-transporting ATPase